MIKETKDPVFGQWYHTPNLPDLSKYQALKRDEHFKPEKEKKSNCRCLTTVKELRTI